MRKKSENRSEKAEIYRKWYKTRSWLVRRERQLSEHPFCAYCASQSIVTPATVADHIVPHRGDETLFWTTALQSLCTVCHNGIKQREDLNGYSLAVGPDGVPLDPRHPANT